MLSLIGLWLSWGRPSEAAPAGEDTVETLLGMRSRSAVGVRPKVNMPGPLRKGQPHGGRKGTRFATLTELAVVPKLRGHAKSPLARHHQE